MNERTLRVGFSVAEGSKVIAGEGVGFTIFAPMEAIKAADLLVESLARLGVRTNYVPKDIEPVVGDITAGPMRALSCPYCGQEMEKISQSVRVCWRDKMRLVKRWVVDDI